MNKKQIQQAAKEFCDKKGIDHIVLEDKTVKWPDVYFSDFLQSMIETGHVTESTDYYELMLKDRVKELEKEVQNYRDTLGNQSTVSSAGKEVKSVEQIKDEYAQESEFEDFYDYLKNSTTGEIDHHVSHIATVFANQFKSSPASTEISDGIIEAEANKRYNHQTDAGQHRNYAFQDGAEWYREQLKSRSNGKIQKDQAFLKFITTTGLSVADQNVIKGVYFKYIEQCQ